MTIMKVMHQRLDLGMALLLGMLAAAGFAPFQLYWATLIGLTGLCVMLHEKKPSYLFFFHCGFFAVGTSWLYHSIHLFGHFSSLSAWLFTFSAIIIFALIPYALFLFAQRYPHFKVLTTAIGLPTLLVMAEWLRANMLFSGFPWLMIGVSQLHAPWSHWLPVVGPYGLGWMVLFCLSMLAQSVMLPSRKNIKNTMALLLCCGILTWLLPQHWTTPQRPPLRVTAITPHSMTPNNAAYQSLQDYVSATKKYGRESTLIIWPESSIPMLIDRYPVTLALLKQSLQPHQFLLFGSFVHHGKAIYNAVIGLGGPEKYENGKHKLVAFGEYFPVPAWLQSMLRQMGVPVTHLSVNPMPPQPFVLPHHILSLPILCYEIAFPTWVARYAAPHHVMVSIHKLSWFASRQAATQQLEMAQARSLENGKPQIFVSEGGPMASINDQGIITKCVPNSNIHVAQFVVQPRQGTTPYNQTLEWPWLLLACLTCITASRKKRHANLT